MSLSVALSSLSAADFWPWLCDVWLKGAAVLLAAAGLALCMRRASAAAQHLLWSAAVAGLVLLPFASAALPRWSLSLPASWFANSDVAEPVLMVAAPAAYEAPTVIDAAFAPAEIAAPPQLAPTISAESATSNTLAAPKSDAERALNVRLLLAAIWTACGVYGERRACWPMAPRARRCGRCERNMVFAAASNSWKAARVRFP